MDNAKLIEAAKLLNEYCAGNGFECTGCIFKDCDGCMFNYDDPSQWLIPTHRRWTDADIALAKALKAFGAYSVQRVSNGGILCLDGNGGCVVPKVAFANLQHGETVLLDEIIAEGGTE